MKCQFGSEKWGSRCWSAETQHFTEQGWPSSSADDLFSLPRPLLSPEFLLRCHHVQQYLLLSTSLFFHVQFHHIHFKLYLLRLYHIWVTEASNTDYFLKQSSDALCVLLFCSFLGQNHTADVICLLVLMVVVSVLVSVASDQYWC